MAPSATQANYVKPAISFVILMAMISSYTALSIDIMLPSLPAIGNSFGISSQRLQQVVTIFIFGMFFGELLFGPISDRFGRRPLIITGTAVFLIGTLLCVFSKTYEQLLCGRLLQGLGAAGPKIVIKALLRDVYQGPALAQVFSLVYTLFVFVPMIAPLLGQGISALYDWHGIFWFLFAFAFFATAIFAIIQPETLLPENRLTLNPKTLAINSMRILAHQKVALIGVLTGIIFGMKLTYLSNAQQMFENYFGIVDLFPLFFALLATAICFAFFLNARLVMVFGGYKLCLFALKLLMTSTGVLLVFTLFWRGTPPFMVFMLCFWCTFFCFGLLWGNLSALAMEYLGSLAGLGSTLTSAGSSLVAFTLSSIVGYFYAAQFLPFAISFFILACLAYGVLRLVIVSSHHHSILAAK